MRKRRGCGKEERRGCGKERRGEDAERKQCRTK